MSRGGGRFVTAALHGPVVLRRVMMMITCVSLGSRDAALYQK
jgi:hypothetical protein